MKRFRIKLDKKKIKIPERENLLALVFVIIPQIFNLELRIIFLTSNHI